MRIVVNDIAASSGGAMSILKDFYNYIIENDKVNEWIFLLGDSYLEEKSNVKIIPMPHIKKNCFNKLLFDLFYGKYFINSLKPDAVFSLQNIITFGLKIPQVVYIHQSIPFQTVKRFSFIKPEERKLAIYQYIIGRLIKISASKSDKVIVQTDWMKNSICSTTKIDKNKIIRAYPSIKDFSTFQNFKKFDNTSFFYPTSNSIYKNNECIYKACLLLNNKGIKNFSVRLTILDKRDIQNISFIGKISREQVFNEYNKSTLILPSYIESFSLPLGEARQIGAIILASDCEFSRELLGGYADAYFFNPFEPQELADLMEKVIKNKIIKKDDRVMDNNKSVINNSWEIVISEIINIKK